MIKRHRYVEKIKQVLALKKAVFLVWARQVGKTSLMKYFQQEFGWVYINFDEIASWMLSFDSLNAFINYLNAYFWIDLEKESFIFFDEITRIQNFNILFKALKDKYPDKNYICSASWDYEIVNSIVEWLAGRIVKIEVFPLTFDEFLLFKWKNIDLNYIDENIFQLIKPFLLEYLSFGWYPEIALTSTIQDKILILKSIIDSVFEKDLSYFITKQEFVNIKKLISYLANNTGNPFSYEGLSERLWIKVKALKFYLDLLEKSYLIYFLPPFFTNKKLEYSSKNKVYVWDFGLVNYFLGISQLKTEISWKDAKITSFYQLRFKKDFMDNLYFYRKINWTEIDFILEKNAKLIPIEAKLTNKDNIPKVFSFFLKTYQDKVDYFIKTTTYKIFERELEWKKVIWKPFYSL